MVHVRKIREIADAGRNEEAHAALDQLLSLGPHNLEALKLRAQLYAYEGRFADEALIWEKVLKVDPDDQDGSHYLIQRQIEDREHFYFTDDLPEGGRKFLAYPRKLLHLSALGLLGCIAFLLATRLTPHFNVLQEPIILLTLFGILVLMPWLGILTTYFTAIKSVGISQKGILLSTRLRKFSLDWQEIEKVYLVHHLPKQDDPKLTLVFLNKDPASTSLEVDINQHSTAIRARSYLVREIARTFGEPEYAHRESLNLEKRKLLIF